VNTAIIITDDVEFDLSTLAQPGITFLELRKIMSGSAVEKL